MKQPTKEFVCEICFVDPVHRGVLCREFAADPEGIRAPDASQNVRFSDDSALRTCGLCDFRFETSRQRVVCDDVSQPQQCTDRF